MNPQSSEKYTEADIQDYAAGSYKGDVQQFERYIASSVHGQELLSQYQLIFKQVKEQQHSMPAFKLADKVIERIEKSENKLNIELQYYPLLLVIPILIYFLIARHFGTAFSLDTVLNSGTFISAAVMMILFSAAFYMLDVDQVKRKFNSTT